MVTTVKETITKLVHKCSICGDEFSDIDMAKNCETLCEKLKTWVPPFKVGDYVKIFHYDSDYKECVSGCVQTVTPEKDYSTLEICPIVKIDTYWDRMEGGQLVITKEKAEEIKSQLKAVINKDATDLNVNVQINWNSTHHKFVLTVSY